MKKLYRNKEWLYNQYWDEEKSQSQIAKECKVTSVIIGYWMKNFDIPSRSISESIKIHWKNNRKLNMEGVKKSAQIRRGRKLGPHSKKWNKKISKTEKGKVVTKETREKQSRSRLKFIKDNPELSKEYSAKAGKKLKGRKQPKHVVEAQRKKWEDPEYKEKRLKQNFNFCKPNKLEKKMIDIIKNNNLPYKFVGDGSLWIKGFCPDFININEKKIIIEIYGDYWHNRKDWHERDLRRIKSFTQLGYKTLVIWESEIRKVTRKSIKKLLTESEIVEKIKSFEKQKEMMDK